MTTADTKTGMASRRPHLALETTELVASADHRYLTHRGWKYVTGAQQGHARRPHLTLNDELKPLQKMYLGDQDAIARKAAAVANQGKAQ